MTTELLQSAATVMKAIHHIFHRNQNIRPSINNL